MQISEIEQRDESLISKIETAICFGKLMLTVKPLIVKSLAGIQSAVQYNAIDKPFQAEHSKMAGPEVTTPSNMGKEEKDLSLL